LEKKTFKLRAKTAEERNKWIEVITETVKEIEQEKRRTKKKIRTFTRVIDQ
jgi:hypothetical protein